jgi:hypothetical protein
LIVHACPRRSRARARSTTFPRYPIAP